MAYVPSNPDDDEEQRRAAAGNAPGSFGDTTPTSAPTKTNFVNVSDYLDKNPNASEHLGDLASSKLASQRDETLGSLNQAKSSFGQQVQSGGATLDNDLLSNAFANPEGFTQDAGNVARFHALRDASYKGPSSLETTDIFAPMQSKVNALNQAGEGLGTEAGRTELVGGLSSHPTHGKSSLNQLLLQGNPAAAQKITDTASTFKGVDDQWQQFVQDAPNQVSQMRTQTDAARNATRSGLDSATQAFMKQLDDQTATATNERDAFNLKYQNTNNAIANNDFNQSTLNDLNIPDAYPYLATLGKYNKGLEFYGEPVNLGEYAKLGQANSNVPTRAGVASPEQYAREAALQQLSGSDLGLPDQQENPYQSNGKMPTLNYMDPFTTAGSRLSGLDKNLVASNQDAIPWTHTSYGVPGAVPGLPYSAELLGGLTAAMSRQNTPNFYTDAAAGGSTPTAPEGPKVLSDPTTSQAGPDVTSQPPQYPQPTSIPPTNLINPQWDPWLGKWVGAQLQPTAPPPTDNGGGGRHTF